MVNTLMSWFYNIFDWGLDTWSAFFSVDKLFSLLITFFIIFMTVRFFIKPIMGGSDGVSSSIRAARRAARRKDK